MNTKEIICKNNITEEEMYSVIEEYILERKNTTITVNNLKGLNIQNGMHQLLYRNRIQQAFDAFCVAGAWLLENKYNE